MKKKTQNKNKTAKNYKSQVGGSQSFSVKFVKSESILTTYNFTLLYPEAVCS